MTRPDKEQQYRRSLLRAERRLILPIKWVMLISVLGLWIAVIDQTPSEPIVLLFTLYAIVNAVETYLVYRDRVTLAQARPLTLISYLADVVWVTMLIFFSQTQYYWKADLYSDFYILYFMLVMRGFALFVTMWEMMFVNALISVMFILVLRIQQTNYDFVTDPAFAVRLVLIWLVLLMAWFVVVVLNQQKMDLIEAHQQLARSENLAQLGILAAGVAHEINNPLGIIVANIEYMKRTTKPDDPRMEDLNAIHHETIRAKNIVQQMLDYANPKFGELKRTAPDEINDEILQFIFPRGRSGDIEVTKEYKLPLPDIVVDFNMIKQALLNIYLNAQQAMADQGSGKIISRIYSRRGKVVFEIEDNGPGIDPEDYDHVFEPFFTRKADGTGLGLAMTQRIIESNNGQIDIEPAGRKGTMVRLTFPTKRK